MDLIGKIFVVAILILSIVFMSLSLMVYATHRNWRDRVENPPQSATASRPVGLRYELENEKKANDALQQELEQLRTTLQMERAARQQALAVLETRSAQLKSELDAKTETLSTLRRQHDQAVTTMELAQTNLKAMKDEVEDLRERIRQAHADRDEQFAKVVAMSDRLNQLEGNQRLLTERNRELTQSVAESARVLDRYGLSRNTPLHNVPPKVDGVVTMVRSSDLIELSLGADDGLRVGHRLDVYRGGGTYLGRIEVMYTDPDQSVARILPDFQQGVIRSGDTVATRLLENVITTASAN